MQLKATSDWLLRNGLLIAQCIDYNICNKTNPLDILTVDYTNSTSTSSPFHALIPKRITSKTLLKQDTANQTYIIDNENNIDRIFPVDIYRGAKGISCSIDIGKAISKVKNIELKNVIKNFNYSIGDNDKYSICFHNTNSIRKEYSDVQIIHYRKIKGIFHIAKSPDNEEEIDLRSNLVFGTTSVDVFSTAGVWTNTIRSVLYIHTDLLTTEKSCDALLKLLTGIQNNNVLYCLYPEKEKEYQQNAKNISVWWDGARNILQGAPLDQLNVNQITTDYTRSNMGILQSYGFSSFMKDYNLAISNSRYIKDQLSKHYNDLETIDNQYRQYAQQLNDIEYTLKDLQQKINQYIADKTNVDKMCNTLASKKREVSNIYEDTYKTFTDSKNTVKDILETTMSSVDTPVVSNKYDTIILSIALNSGFKYTYNKENNTWCRKDIVYTEKEFYTELQKKRIDGCYICDIAFDTQVPVAMKVDAGFISNPPIIYGGPYILNVNYSSSNSKVTGVLKLKSLASVFGMQRISDIYSKVKIHPHSAPMEVATGDIGSIQQLLSRPAHACFGEIEPNIKKSMQDLDISSLIISIENYLHNVWSGDKWGADWKWFPTTIKDNK